MRGAALALGLLAGPLGAQDFDARGAIYSLNADAWIAQGAPDADGVLAPNPTGARIRLRGTLTGEAEIDGAGFVLDSGTRVDDRPRIGGPAEMRGEVQPDGSVRAERFRDR